LPNTEIAQPMPMDDIFQIPQSNPESCVSDNTFTKKYDLHSLYNNNTI
jgi:hypothetical protein